MDCQNPNINKSSGGRKAENNDGKSAKWKHENHSAFVDLCEEEVQQGNRGGAGMRVEVWRNMVPKFKERTGEVYTWKQLKNHWGAMRSDWTLFKQLMEGESGLGWDASRNTIAATDEWWENKIKENEKFKKFRRFDLSLYWFRYDALFSDTVANGERARAPIQVEPLSQRPYNAIEDEEFEKYDNEEPAQHNEEIPKAEGSGDTDEVQLPTNNGVILLPSSNTKRSFSSGMRSSSGKKMKVSSTTSLKEDIQALMQLVSSASTSTSSIRPTSESSVRECMEKLQNLPGMIIGSEMWHFACSHFVKKAAREVFLMQPTDELKYSWLEFSYANWKKS